MVRSACTESMLQPLSQDIGFGSPECRCHRKFRHRFLCLLTFYIIDDQTEAVSQVNQGGCNTRAFLGSKYQVLPDLPGHPCNGWHSLMLILSICNGWADFQHMSLKNPFLALHQVVCIIFQKGWFPLASFIPAVMIFIRRTMAAVFQSPSAPNP